MAYDNVLSAPKEVSILFSQAPNEKMRNLILECHKQAVQEAIAYLETTAFTRTGRNGVKAEKVSMIAAVFDHTTSRELDPQLHSHVVVLNTGLKADGKGAALDGKRILDARYTVGTIYQNSLRRSLELKIGVQTYDRPYEKGNQKGCLFGIKGIPTEVVQHFSKRATQIDQDISPEMSDKEIRAAKLKSRKAKDPNVNGKALLKKWQQEGKEQGFEWDAVVNHQIQQPKSITAQEKEKIERDVATTLQTTQKKGGFTQSQLKNVVVNASNGKLNQEQQAEFLQNYQAHYIKPTSKSERFRLNAQGKKLIDFPSLSRQAWQGVQGIINLHKQNIREQGKLGYQKAQKRFKRKMVFLYATGKITRRKYLQITEGKNLPSSKFKIIAYQAFGLISKRQANYLLQQRAYRQKNVQQRMDLKYARITASQQPQKQYQYERSF